MCKPCVGAKVVLRFQALIAHAFLDQSIPFLYHISACTSGWICRKRISFISRCGAIVSHFVRGDIFFDSPCMCNRSPYQQKSDCFHWYTKRWEHMPPGFVINDPNNKLTLSKLYACYSSSRKTPGKGCTQSDMSPSHKEWPSTMAVTASRHLRKPCVFWVSDEVYCTTHESSPSIFLWCAVAKLWIMYKIYLNHLGSRTSMFSKIYDRMQSYDILMKQVLPKLCFLQECS